GDILMLKCHGGWKSNTVAEGNIEDSISRKKEISNKIQRGGESSHFPIQNDLIKVESDAPLVNICPKKENIAENENEISINNVPSENDITFPKYKKCSLEKENIVENENEISIHNVLSKN
ncbi:hypothetical protein PV325_009505, partial [Microctonus aethiopoides]